MKRTSRKTREPRIAAVDWSRARPNRFARELADKRWWVTLDPELVALLSGRGGPAARVLGFAERRRSSESRRVLSIPMTEKDFTAVRPVLDRIGAAYRYVPPHPNTRVLKRAPRARRSKAA